MRITQFTKPKAIVTLVSATVFLVDANLILPYLGVELDAGGIFIARILGAVYLALGIDIWMISGAGDFSSKTAHLYALAEILAAVICVLAVANNVLNAVGFVLAAAYALFAGGFYWVARILSQQTTVAQS